jgi:hypothetical protein
MRVFLRNTKTRLYCADPNGWAAAAGQALDFTSVPHAARFALDERLLGFEIVVRYDSLEEEVTVPLLAEWCDLDHAHSVAA